MPPPSFLGSFTFYKIENLDISFLGVLPLGGGGGTPVWDLCLGSQNGHNLNDILSKKTKTNIS